MNALVLFLIQKFKIYKFINDYETNYFDIHFDLISKNTSSLKTYKSCDKTRRKFINALYQLSSIDNVLYLAIRDATWKFSDCISTSKLVWVSGNKSYHHFEQSEPGIFVQEQKYYILPNKGNFESYIVLVGDKNAALYDDNNYRSYIKHKVKSDFFSTCMLHNSINYYNRNKSSVEEYKNKANSDAIKRGDFDKVRSQ